MASKKDIIEAIRILKKSSKHFENTALMELADVPANPFQVLISCIISLRTRDQVTAVVSRRLFAIAPTPKKLMTLTPRTIEKLIYPCSFYRTKAPRIKEIARIIHEDYHDRVPDTLDELLALKGVGRKTANITMVYGHNRKHHIPVDTHVHRIPNRLGWVQTKTPEQTEVALMQIIPRRYWQTFNELFVSFGQSICRPVGPRCAECPIKHYCNYYAEVYARQKQIS